MKKSDRWHFWFIGLVMVAGFVALTLGLANLQIRSADEYSGIAESSMTKTLSESGTRGQIQDADGGILAYSRKMYNVTFYRNPSSKEDQNAAYSKSIWEVIKLLRKEGREVTFDFWLAQDENGEWKFDTKTDNESVANAREAMFRSNFYVKNVELQDIYDRLSTNYGIDRIDDEPGSEKLTMEDKLLVLGVWQEMQMNAFNSVPIVLATDINWSTVIEIETRLVTLSGIEVSVEDQRVYPRGTLACHILGYVGLMQSESQIEQYVTNGGYLRTDRIGLDGIEKYMEAFLTGNSSDRRGYSLVEIDRNGRQIRQLSRTEPSDGNTVRLTIRSDLQQVVERELETIVNTIRDTEEKKLKDGKWLEDNREVLAEYQADEQALKLAQNGAIVVLDMECRVLAMASYPNYDPNLFVIGMDEEQRLRMLKDERNPLFNYAIQAKSIPGSVFKMATALAALANGKLTVTETISDEGYFTEYDRTNPPKCWINIHLISRHANLTVVQGLEYSCNYFFYTLGSRLGSDGEALYEYAAKLGLTSRTNIELPGEAKSVVGSQATLYDPTKPINGYDQGTWYPVQVKAKLKDHLQMIGETYNITYSEERLDKCIKALMDMAVRTEQGTDQQTWIRAFRPILMEELGMTREMVYRQLVMGDLVRYLNELKWGGTYTIQTAIGQGITLITPIAMARYVAAVANGGYVYDVQLVDSILSPTGEVVQSFDTPVLVNDLSGEIGEYLPYIHEGMHGVVDESGTAQSYFVGWPYRDQIAGKTGTAETSELDVEHNSWFVAFAPFDEPEIAVVVYVPHGLSGAMSSPAAKAVIEYYLESRVEDYDLVLPAPNGLAQ